MLRIYAAVEVEVLQDPIYLVDTSLSPLVSHDIGGALPRHGLVSLTRTPNRAQVSDATDEL